MLQVLPAGNKGSGVFTDSVIKKCDVIEQCPILSLSPEDDFILEQTILDNYWFSWKEGSCLVFGYGMLYNHSDQPNAIVYQDHARNLIRFTALRDIEEGEEICHDYRYGQFPGKKVVFNDTGWELVDML